MTLPIPVVTLRWHGKNAVLRRFFFFFSRREYWLPAHLTFISHLFPPSFEQGHDILVGVSEPLFTNNEQLEAECVQSECVATFVEDYR